MTGRTVAGRALAVIGGVLVAVGVFGAGAYVVGVVQVLDEPDRSWLFWGLALLLGGMLLVRLGIRLVVLGRSVARSSPAGRA